MFLVLQYEALVGSIETGGMAECLSPSTRIFAKSSLSSVLMVAVDY